MEKGGGESGGGATDSKVTNDEGEEIQVLQAREPPSTVIGFLKKLAGRSVAWVGVYLLGYFGFSIAWTLTPLLLSALRDTWKKDKRQRLAAARETALTNEQAMIESRFARVLDRTRGYMSANGGTTDQQQGYLMQVDELPSWVYFPDKERAEWLNSIIKQLWPNVNTYVRKMLFETVEPLVKTTLDEYKLKGFKFERERVFLGQVPPRISGVKTYGDKHTSRQEIIMDVDLVYASDLEVVFSIKGISARISDFSLRGMLRVVLKPLITDIPLIGGVQVYFLTVPEIDYSLGGVAGALDVPGLSKIVENIVLEQVRKFIVLPNKFTLPLVANLPMKELKCPATAGVLRVTLIRAKELMQKDVGFLAKKGSSDPYAILTVGATTHKTRTKNSSCNPIWEETYDFPIEVVHGQQLMMEFFDEDDNRDDEFLGRATVQTGVVAENGIIEGYWVDLEECESGSVEVTLAWLPVTRDPARVTTNTTTTSTGSLAACVVHVWVDSCTGLGDARNPAYKPSPMVQLTCGKTVRQTWPKYYTTEPVVEQGFVMLINNPHTDNILVKVVDTGKSNKVIGELAVGVWSVIQEPGMEYPIQPWTLKGQAGHDPKILLSASVRGLLPPEAAPQYRRSGSSSPEATLEAGFRKVSSESVGGDPISGAQVTAGRLVLVLHRAVDLEKRDVGGKSDPYAVVKYEGQEHSTGVVKKTLNPEWNHEMVLNISENGDSKIYIKLWDKDKLGKDESLGEMVLDLKRVVRQGTLTNNWEVLSNCPSGKLLYSAQFYPTVRVASPPTPVSSPPPSSTPPPSSPPPSSPPHSSPPPPSSSPPVEAKLADLDGNEDEAEGVVEEDMVDQEVVHSRSQERESPVGGGHTSENILGSPTAPPLGYLPLPEVGEGFLRVTVHRAIDLVKMDALGKSDPYVVIRYDNQSDKSKTVKNDLNPEFEFQTGFVTADRGPSDLRIEVWDKDVGKDEAMGYTIFDIRKAVEDGSILNYWCNLSEAKSGRILISLEFNSNSHWTPADEMVRRPSENNIIAAAIGPAIGLVSPGHVSPTGDEESVLRKRAVAGLNGRIRLTLLYDEPQEELKVFVHEAAGLPGGDLPDPPDPYVKVYLMPGKKKKKKTQVVKDSGSPRWDEEFDFSLAHRDLPHLSIKVVVVDKKRMFNKSPILGTTTITLDNPGIFQGIADWFPLEHSDEDSD